jgi:hypothetical protein
MSRPEACLQSIAVIALTCLRPRCWSLLCDIGRFIGKDIAHGVEGMTFCAPPLWLTSCEELVANMLTAFLSYHDISLPAASHQRLLIACARNCHLNSIFVLPCPVHCGKHNPNTVMSHCRFQTPHRHTIPRRQPLAAYPPVSWPLMADLQRCTDASCASVRPRRMLGDGHVL